MPLLLYPGNLLATYFPLRKRAMFPYININVNISNKTYLDYTAFTSTV